MTAPAPEKAAPIPSEETAAFLEWWKTSGRAEQYDHWQAEQAAYAAWCERPRADRASQEERHTPECIANVGEREKRMVVIERDDAGKPTVWCDPCIAPLVKALNDSGIRTVASCCGHSHRPGNIALADGRWLVIGRDEVEWRRIEALFPIDINGEDRSQEERIREDERDALFLAAERAKRRHIRSWIGMRGGMFPADRARLRGDAS